MASQKLLPCKRCVCVVRLLPITCLPTRRRTFANNLIQTYAPSTFTGATIMTSLYVSQSSVGYLLFCAHCSDLSSNQLSSLPSGGLPATLTSLCDAQSRCMLCHLTTPTAYRVLTSNSFPSNCAAVGGTSSTILTNAVCVGTRVPWRLTCPLTAAAAVPAISCTYAATLGSCDCGPGGSAVYMVSKALTAVGAAAFATCGSVTMVYESWAFTSCRFLTDVCGAATCRPTSCRHCRLQACSH